MEIITDIASLRTRLKRESSIALVPTMGNLHQGHLSLVQLAQQHAGCTVVSIFVNRLQFAPHEDFDRYPRTQTTDCHLLEQLGVEIVFLPDEKELYPVPQEFQLLLPAVADTLEGQFRPGFFRGVAIIVLKLFNIVQPHIAIFGKKDYQQLHLMQKMGQQLNLPIEIMAGETVRAEDGLALSSRNSYLSESQRQQASHLFRTLFHVKQKIEQGDHNLRLLEERAKCELAKQGWKVDYIALQQRKTLLPANTSDTDLVILGAGWLGQTRLIDNLEIALTL
ncbi:MULTISPECIES: pantoate--beta-alanine ligase [Nitrosomonas]|uniref:Pantothenate synthetase n=1 Tax=Nitrosomonas communis TaxID=44574 RepID=A0A0F7KG62_9PROT|nr:MULTISPECIES: pantoate--beta-alanine ligase [Nitrosomonas]AKH37842.1 pantothenate synthetase [Nitrosomonas communis]TYP92882.1 pantoate--beta-alanine ligase [Nitrosomonas communis]UVS63194.1 pantoate--beta-alanine ligase [Nitrosomonas sp. PLL12]